MSVMEMTNIYKNSFLWIKNKQKKQFVHEIEYFTLFFFYRYANYEPISTNFTVICREKN